MDARGADRVGDGQSDRLDKLEHDQRGHQLHSGSRYFVQRAVDALGRDRIIGVVLNRVESGRVTGGESSYYNSYYYGSKGRS